MIFAIIAGILIGIILTLFSMWIGCNYYVYTLSYWAKKDYGNFLRYLFNKRLKNYEK